MPRMRRAWEKELETNQKGDKFQGPALPKGADYRETEVIR
jgi:hypothetical protein